MKAGKFIQSTHTTKSDRLNILNPRYHTLFVTKKKKRKEKEVFAVCENPFLNFTPRPTGVYGKSLIYILSKD